MPLEEAKEPMFKKGVAHVVHKFDYKPNSKLKITSGLVSNISMVPYNLTRIIDYTGTRISKIEGGKQSYDEHLHINRHINIVISTIQ